MQEVLTKKKKMLCFRRSLSLSCARASTNVLFLFFGLKALEYAWIYSFRARRREERRELTFASGASLSRGGRVFSLLFFLRTQNAVCLFFEGNFYTHPREELFRKKKQNRNALPSRRARTKKTRLDDAERRDVPFFARRKRVLLGKRRLSRARCLCTRLVWRELSPIEKDIYFGGRKRVV